MVQSYFFRTLLYRLIHKELLSIEICDKSEMKHCQRHHGPEGWVLLTNVTSGVLTQNLTGLCAQGLNKNLTLWQNFSFQNCIKLSSTRFWTSTSATVTSFGLESSHARVTSIKSTKQIEWVGESVSDKGRQQWLDSGLIKINKCRSKEVTAALEKFHWKKLELAHCIKVRNVKLRCLSQIWSMLIVTFMQLTFQVIGTKVSSPGGSGS